MTDKWLIYSPSHVVNPHLLEDVISMYACTLLSSWISQCWSPFQTDIHCMHCVCLQSRLHIIIGSSTNRKLYQAYFYTPHNTLYFTWLYLQYLTPTAQSVCLWEKQFDICVCCPMKPSRRLVSPDTDRAAFYCFIAHHVPDCYSSCWIILLPCMNVQRLHTREMRTVCSNVTLNPPSFSPQDGLCFLREWRWSMI